MAPVDGRPFLEHLLGWLARQGLTDIILCVGYRSEQIEGWFGDGHERGLKIAYSREGDPLGTAGALRRASSLLRPGEVVVLNGDSYLEVHLAQLVDYHHARASVATLALARVADTSRYGTVEADDGGRILEFDEKGRQGAGWVNGGVYVLSGEARGRLTDSDRSLETDVLPRLVGRGLFGMRVAGYFVDIGTPQAYTALAANPRPFLESINR